MIQSKAKCKPAQRFHKYGTMNHISRRRGLENMEQSKFLSQCKDLIEYARANENKLTKKEIKNYFSDMRLSDKQLHSVYAFLTENHIEITHYIKPKAEKSEPDSVYLKIYKNELKHLPVPAEEEMEEYYRKLQDGDSSIVHAVIESFLKRVVTIAGKYRNRGVLLEDLIQEGNLKLISCVNQMLGKKSKTSPKKQIERAIKSHLISLVDEAMNDGGKENTILAKTNLVYEATKIYAEENGTVANIHELAEYTKISEEEILDIIDLSLDEIKLGECHHEQKQKPI